MRLIKPAGQDTDRPLKLHGSAARRGMAKWGGQLQRRCSRPNGSKSPGRGKK